jgi:hypothetical protein
VGEACGADTILIRFFVIMIAMKNFRAGPTHSVFFREAGEILWRFFVMVFSEKISA